MRKRPFLLLACMFLAGILAQRYHAWLLAVPVLLAGFVIWRGEEGSRRGLLLTLTVMLFTTGALRMGSEMCFRDRYLSKLGDGQELRLVGEVARVEEKSRLVYVYLTNCVLSSNVPCNDVLAYVKTGNVSVGQVLAVRGNVALFEGPPNEGGFDSKAFYQSQRIDFGLWVEAVEREVRAARPWQSALVRLRERLTASIEACGAEDGVLAAMLLGEKSSLDAEVKEMYQQAGISHILAISGLHVTLLGIGLYRLLRRVGLRYLGAGCATGTFMLCYSVMTGSSVPTRRAIGMLIVLLVADVIGRGYDMLSALGLMCIVLLWDNPFLIGYSGFWFSVLAVLGVGVVGPVIAEWAVPLEETREKSFGARLRSRGCALLHQTLVSFGIQLAMLPLVAYNYYEVPVYALLLNTAVLALVKYLLGIGGVAAVVGMGNIRFGGLFMAPCNAILRLYESLCSLTLECPGAQVITGCPSPWQIAAYYAALGLVLFVMQRRAIVRSMSPEVQEDGAVKQAVCKTAGIAVSVLSLFVILTFRPAEGFALDVLDVGQGDGIYLHAEDGCSLFIDGGSTGVSSVGKYRILPFLKYKGVKRVSYWFVSHTDADHVSGLVEVLESGYPVDHLVLAEAVRGEEKTGELAELAGKCGAEVLYLKAGDVLRSKSMAIYCLYPHREAGQKDGNELSLVLRVECGGFRGLFAGDIPAEAEKVLLKEGRIEPVDFYKAAHHGSRYSNSEEFLQALSPAVSVISCGKNNRYGHPGAEAVEHMEAAGSLVFRTDESGEVKLTMQQGRLIVEEFCNQAKYVVK